MNVITSKDNKKIKDLIKLRDDSNFRRDKSLFYVEGLRLIKDTPSELIEEIYIEESQVDIYNEFKDKYDDKIYIVSNAVLDKIKSTINSQGIVAVVKYNHIGKFEEIDFSKINNILILDKIQDPGNLGTIIRSSEAFNIDLIILSQDCCDLYNIKVIRSCMSSIFRSMIYVTKDLIECVKSIKKNNFKIYVSVLDNNSKRIYDSNFKVKLAVIVGNEANGIRDDIINLADEKIYIPMCGQIESLNAAIASSVICYELMKQKYNYES